jgi:hypothetical protein
MKKFPISFGFALLVLSSLIIVPIRANAGQAVIQGTTPDSSSFGGDSFSPAVTQPAPPQAAPGTGASVGGNGQISVPPSVQASVNNTAASVSTQLQSLAPLALSVIQGTPGAAAQLTSALTGALGVSPASAAALVNALAGLFASTSAAQPGVPVAELKAVQLVASTKSLIAQKAGTPNVDVTKLNAAITAYNKIVLESSPETLQALAKDPQFLAIGQSLKELRAALSAS